MESIIDSINKQSRVFKFVINKTLEVYDVIIGQLIDQWKVIITSLFTNDQSYSSNVLLIIHLKTRLQIYSLTFHLLLALTHTQTLKVQVYLLFVYYLIINFIQYTFLLVYYFILAIKNIVFYTTRSIILQSIIYNYYLIS